MSALRTIAKPATFTARATGALAVGVFDVAKDALAARTERTIGNKLATAISNRRSKREEPAGQPAKPENTLSAGKQEPVDWDAEVAAFRDREPDKESGRSPPPKNPDKPEK
jgi:hypothetical protein